MRRTWSTACDENDASGSFPFVLFPRDLPWPDKPVVGAAAVHRILYEWLALLGQDAYATDDRRPAAPAPTAEPVAH